MQYWCLVVLLTGTVSLSVSRIGAGFEDPLVCVADVNLDETQQVTLHNGEIATLKLLGVRESRDQVMRAIREVQVDVELNGERATLVSGLYRRPQRIGGVQVDCPVTFNYNKDSHVDHWALEKHARFRLWPQDSPWIRPASFVYPVGQRWFASQTWFSNEAVSRRPSGKFYYHAGLDIGAADRVTPVFAATDGRVVSVGEEREPGLPDSALKQRYDVVNLRDSRGWIYRYSHLSFISTPVRLGSQVRAGQQIGVVGKEGGSGGWSHLHFEIKSMQPSGRWGTQDGYAFLWQAYQQKYPTRTVAVARPRRRVVTGEPVTLDGGNSWSAAGIRNYAWQLSDGARVTGPTVTQIYEQPGTYNEVLWVTGQDGSTSVDFAIVTVADRQHPDEPVPGIHATYYPSFGMQANDPIEFQVRARRTIEGVDVWDFGDGTQPVTVRSNLNPDQHADVGYAKVIHRYQKAGQYLVTVRRDTSTGSAVDRLMVEVQ